MRTDYIQLPLIPIINELVKNHPNTISLGQGVVFYPPPEASFQYLQLFQENSANNLYQSVHGIPELLTEIKQKLVIDNNIIYDDNQQSIFVTAGANMAFLNVVLGVTDPHEEIIILSPYYFNHEMELEWQIVCQ